MSKSGELTYLNNSLSINRMKEIPKYSNCFVCGDNNKHGLQAKFFYDGENAITEIVAGKEMEGYQGIYHGGIISALLDEIMIKAVLAIDKFVVTAEMTVRYILPVRTGEKIRFTGTIRKTNGKIYYTQGEAMNEKQEVVAKATGKYIEVEESFRKELMNSIE